MLTIYSRGFQVFQYRSYRRFFGKEIVRTFLGKSRPSSVLTQEILHIEMLDYKFEMKTKINDRTS